VYVAGRAPGWGNSGSPGLAAESGETNWSVKLELQVKASGLVRRIAPESGVCGRGEIVRYADLTFSLCAPGVAALT
jgi:hypothetical protein